MKCMIRDSRIGKDPGRCRNEATWVTPEHYLCGAHVPASPMILAVVEGREGRAGVVRLLAADMDFRRKLQEHGRMAAELRLLHERKPVSNIQIKAATDALTAFERHLGAAPRRPFI